VLFRTDYTIYTLSIFDRFRVRVKVRINVQIQYSNSMTFKNSLSASWLVRELSSPRLDWPRVGLSASCPWTLLVLGPKCLMHFSAEVSETFRHWCLQHQRKNLRHFGIKHMVPKCLGSEVSVHWGLSKNRGDDGTTTGQDGASLPQLATMSSPWWRDGADDGTAIMPIDESLVIGATGQTLCTLLPKTTFLKSSTCT